MNPSFKIKNRQVSILKNEILDSWLIDEDILNDVEKLYLNNPYHNFLHALRVASYVLLLDKSKFSPIEIRSLIIAGLFHDAGHTWTAMELDEFTSLNHFRLTMDKYPDFLINDSICRNWIIWTVFKNRWKNINKYAELMWDLDIWDIWMWLPELLYYSSWFSLELWVNAEIFYTEVEKGYFKYLIWIDRNIIISKDVRQILPNSYNTIKDFYEIWISLKLEIFECLLNEDITLEEFKEKFFK